MVRLMITFFFCLSAITAEAKVRKIMYYDIKDSLFLGYLQKSIEKNAIGDKDTIYKKVAYVSCVVLRKKSFVMILFF